MLRIGDRLEKPIYGTPSGSRSPVLLMAAGQRIDTEAQLRRLREAGFEVELPSEPASLRSVFVATPSVGGPDADGWTFGRRLVEARRLRGETLEAANHLVRRLSSGSAPDLGALHSAVRQLAQAVTGDPEALVVLTHLEQCDDYTVGHCVDVSILMTALAHVLGYPEPELPTVALAGLLHDVGKQRVPGRIISKPGPLTADEFGEVRRHPEHGERILTATSGAPEAVIAVALQHHERLDGSGYPFGVGGRQIHPLSRVAAVADTFDAITADRVYRRGVSPRQALREIFGEGARFDPTVVAALIRLVGVYPVGTRIRLSTGETGVVVAPNPLDSTRPMVRLERDADGRAFEEILHTDPTDRTWRIAGEV